eukprot:s3038_g18.t2
MLEQKGSPTSVISHLLWRVTVTDCSNACVLHRLFLSIGRKQANLHANVHSFSSKEWISNCTNANTLTEAIVQPPKLVEHLVAVQVGGDETGKFARSGKTSHIIFKIVVLPGWD